MTAPPTAASAQIPTRLAWLMALVTWCSAAAAAIPATAPASAEPPPEVSGTYAVAPDILAIDVREMRHVRGHVEPYLERDGDVLKGGRLFRGGAMVGQMSPDGKKLIRYSHIIGERLDAKWAGASESYRVTSPDDDTFPAGAPLTVHRKSRPLEFANATVGEDRPLSPPVEHAIYLKLRQPMRPGYSYRIQFVGGPWPDTIHCHEPQRQRSEAVHVTHLGFRPDDPSKTATLSCWMGSGEALSYPKDTKFRIIECRSGREAFVGEARLAQAAGDTSVDSFARDYNGTDVLTLDFSAFVAPGTWVVSVDGVGCSFPFEMRDDVWSRGFRTAARGIYHFRQGVEFGPPYTSWRNPRYFHPDDGDVVREGPVAFDVHIMTRTPRYDQNKLGPVLPGVWGGHRDAGDYQHGPRNIHAAWYLAELVEMFPSHFAAIRHDIPESNNKLPDALDEALFGLDLYRRLQADDGGIREGVFTEGALIGGWAYRGPRIAYKPGCIGTYTYVTGAVRAARCLARWDEKLAKVYEHSAVRAMEWGEAHWKDWPAPRNGWTMRRRATAAAEMFAFNGEARWNEAFKDSITSCDFDRERRWDELEAAWVYARIDRADVDRGLKSRCRELLLANADFALDQVNTNAFGWAKKARDLNVIASLSSPSYGPALVRAHALTGDRKYLAGAIRNCQFGLGGNPQNLCYTTKFGHRSPQHPFNLDLLAYIAEPPDGFCLPGPMDMKYLGSKDYFRQEDCWVYGSINRFAYPELSDWPAMESYFDVFWLYPMHEDMVQGAVSNNAYTWGYLSARKAN